MKSFRQLLSEKKAPEGKLTHLDHLEEEIFNGGIGGIKKALDFLRALRDMLAGKGTKKVNVTVKFDGAPSVVTGINPDNGKFFVATKSAFNANPLLYYSEAEIDKSESGDKAEKLKLMFRYLKELGIKGVIQGDFMFAEDTLKHQTIHGDKFLTFQPNTITYAVPADSDLAREIKSKKMGIVFHTHYVGKTFAELKAVFGYDTTQLRKSKNVWVRDAYFRDQTGTAMFDELETEEFSKYLSQAGRLFNQINPSFINSIAENEDLRIGIKAHDNSKIRDGKSIDDPVQHAESLIQFLRDRHDKKISSVKTDAAKAPKIELRDKELEFFFKHKDQVHKVYELYNAFVSAKHMIINKLKTIKDLGTFIKDAEGFKVTDPEGFVAIKDGEALKLVDRLQFSKANFDPNVKKGWQRT